VTSMCDITCIIIIYIITIIIINAMFLKSYNPHISDSITWLAMILINGNLQTNNLAKVMAFWFQ